MPTSTPREDEQLNAMPTQQEDLGSDETMAASALMLLRGNVLQQVEAEHLLSGDEDEKEPMSATALSPPPLSEDEIELRSSTTVSPPPLTCISQNEKEVLGKYMLFNDLQECLNDRLNSSIMVKYILYHLEAPPIACTQMIFNCFIDDPSILTLSLEKKLQCDQTINKLMGILGNTTHELNLFELEQILNLFSITMFFKVYIFKCLAGNITHCIPPYQKHPVSNISLNYKNIYIFIENILEYILNVGHPSFLNMLYINIKQLNIPFKFPTTKKGNEVLKWLNDAKDLQNNYEHLRNNYGSLELDAVIEETLNLFP